MNRVNQAFRIKIAYRRNYGGYTRRLRRLYAEKKAGIGRYPMGPTTKQNLCSLKLGLFSAEDWQNENAAEISAVTS